jgi:hypothetical protein
MNFKCFCGVSLSNAGCPNEIEHLLIDGRSQEMLEHLVEKEVENNGEINMWVEHWEESKSVIVWKCYNCKRLYVNAEGDPEQVTVYKIERKGIEPERRTIDSYSIITDSNNPDSNNLEIKSVIWKW